MPLLEIMAKRLDFVDGDDLYIEACEAHGLPVTIANSARYTEARRQANRLVSMMKILPKDSAVRLTWDRILPLVQESKRPLP